jgi:hypothetical protein
MPSKCEVIYDAKEEKKDETEEEQRKANFQFWRSSYNT